MPDEYKNLLVGLLYDNWAAEAANLSSNYKDSRCPMHLCPTLLDRIRLARYWCEETRHAFMFCSLLRELGVELEDRECDKQPPGVFLNLSIESWVDFVLFQFFADHAGLLHLREYEGCTYAPLDHVAAAIVKDELGHISLAYENLKNICKDSLMRERAIELLPKWQGPALTLLGKEGSRRTERLIAFGLRKRRNEELRDEFVKTTSTILEELGLLSER